MAEKVGVGGGGKTKKILKDFVRENAETNKHDGKRWDRTSPLKGAGTLSAALVAWLGGDTNSSRRSATDLKMWDWMNCR
jgi:hypothetical protein